MYKRVFLIVMDSVGIGEAPDAEKYNDKGANTLGHIAEHMNGLHMPNMQKLGLGNIHPLQGIEKEAKPLAYYTKMEEKSVGKDTMTGHWEIMGLYIDTPFQVFENGFPDELINEFEKRTGRKVIGNKPASGTEILDELGEEHMKTGALIVYTSADSVFQIAAHEEVVPIDELYRYCEIARELTLDEKYMVGRVIARPFVGEAGAFKRTPNRHDYALKPFGHTVMNELKDNHFDVLSIGKISDIYDGEGITKSLRTVSNMYGVDKLIETLKMDFTGLSFVNLVDFDAIYGHRRNPQGYGEALQEYDVRLTEVFELLKEDDLLMITADHGNDPVHHGTDHTREYVPLLVYSKGMKEGKELPIRETFADIGATIADNFKVTLPEHGTSFYKRYSDGGKNMTQEFVQAAAHHLQGRITEKPEVGFILGSGLGVLVEEIENQIIVPYEEIPSFPVSTVQGHAGRLVFGTLNGISVVAMQGRFHFYEGYNMSTVTFPVRVMKALGIEKLVVTNAAGGVNTNFEPGDLMLISDHINFMGSNPLIGPNDDNFGTRFPDMSEPYTKSLREQAKKVAGRLHIPVKEGVYLAVTGPSYETPAEIRMMRTLGADAVGMSTVPEVIVAQHAGLEVLGISCITNMAAGILDQPLNHEEVIETTERVKANFLTFVKETVKEMK